MAETVVPVTMDDLRIALRTISLRVLQLEMSVEDIMKAGPQIGGGVQTRVRANFSPPTKDRGWNCEHTVEIENAGTIDWEATSAAWAKAYEMAEAECTRRDNAEGRARRHYG
jgi:hypothetical protein